MAEQPPSDDLMRCPYCGQMTSTQANFCYYCARELVARPEHPSEEQKPQINGVAAAVILLLILAFVIYVLIH